MKYEVAIFGYEWSSFLPMPSKSLASSGENASEDALILIADSKSHYSGSSKIWIRHWLSNRISSPTFNP